MKDYLGFFYNTTICKYETDQKFYQSSACETVDSGKYAIFFFSVKMGEKKGSHNLSVHQLNS